MKKSAPILYATDFSPASRAALDQACVLARDRRAPLVITHVLLTPSPLVLEGAVFPQALQELETQIRADAVRRLAALAKRVKKTGLAVTAILLRGVPHQEIVKLARKRGAAMVVVGTHGRTGVSRLIVGSVAGRLVAAATCPVLTVRGH